MPSTVRSLFASAGVECAGSVRWGVRIPRPPAGGSTGVYIVALTDDAETVTGVEVAPVSLMAAERLLSVRPELTVDGCRPSAAELAQRLAQLWHPHEDVLYAGLAGPRRHATVSALSDRVAEYHSTPLGASSPHAGGWPLKTLAVLDQLHVHYGYCAGFVAAERAILDAFAAHCSPSGMGALPFANLRDGHGRRRPHGIKGARRPKRPPTTAPSKRRPQASGREGRVSAEELASRVGVDGKTLRRWLRARATAGHPLLGEHEHNRRWWFSRDAASKLEEEYRWGR